MKMKLIQLLALLLFSQFSMAQFEEGKEEVQINYISGDSLLSPAGASKTQNYTSHGEYSRSIKNIICFKIKEEALQYLSQSFIATVQFDLETSAGTVSKSLTVNFDTALGAKYNTRAYIVLPEQEEMVKITVTGITPNNTTGFNPRPVLQLDNEMRITRYFHMSGDVADLVPTFFSPVDSIDAVRVSWGWDTAAHNNGSQLEWAWVENEMAPYYANKSFLFKTNSTRVDLERDYYRIPLLYDGVGKLYYRVRPILRKSNGSIIAGPWSNADSISFNGHEPDINWQSSSSFAEDGKLKTVIQYFDGSMRNRQTVTKDNSSGNTVVAETIYDLQGRPNLQILPTPIFGNTIKYFKDFNRFVGQGVDAGGVVENPAKYFDLTPAAVLCERSRALIDTQGNGKYYSSNNPWLPTEQSAKFIPDAEGYAFTETRYMDDATERIRSQGGVGLTHQINSGHETMYYYGKPTQHELDALFATEVGDASHYSKNMVRDANGQMSVSYLDMHGRVIATALAGDAAPNTASIAVDTSDYPAASSPLTNQLLTPVNNIINGNTIEAVSSILVPARTYYSFTYKLDPGILNLLTCNNTHLCYDCKYNLEISIKSENCGDTTPVVRRYENLQIVPGDSACSKAMWFKGPGADSILKQITFTDTLDIGSYIVRKTLTVNDSIYQVRRDSALKVLLCKTEQNLFDSIYNLLVKNSSCGSGLGSSFDCLRCLSKLGTYSTYKTQYLASIGNPEEYDENAIHAQYAEDSTVCANACGALNTELTTLKVFRNQMLEDMMPFTGQYAVDSVRDTLGNVYPLTSSRLEAKFNIFDSTLAYPGHTKPFFRHPDHENGQLYYFNELDLVDSTIHGHDLSGQVILDTISMNRYSALFQRSWANSLIKYHPEYSKLQIAEGILRSSYEWLDSMQSMDSYATALANNFDKPFTIPASGPHQDPFMITYASSTDRLIMDKRIHVGVNVDLSGSYASGPSLWQIANSTVLCADVDSLHKEGCIVGLPASAKTGMDPSITDPEKRDLVWERFRGLYLNYRNELVLKYINDQTGVLSRVDMDTLLTEGKRLVFANNNDNATQNGAGSWWPAASTGNTASLDTLIPSISSTYNTDKCLSMKPFWRARLLQCDSLMRWLNNETHADSVLANTIIDSILNGMVSVCHHSQTAQQIYGASNVEPSYSGTPRDFEHVINPILHAYGIDTTGHSGYFCNPYTITYPKPYNLNPPLLTNYSSTIDSCGCRRFGELKVEAHNNGVDTLSMSAMNAYLQTNYNDTISAPLWAGLQKCKDMFKDTCYTIFDTVVCPKPKIRNVSHNPGSDSMYVYYNPDSSHTLCEIFVYDVSGSLVTNQTIACNDSVVVMDKKLDTCSQYKIILIGWNDSCGKRQSDTFYYQGCCPKPVITSVTYDPITTNIYVHYLPQANYTQCELEFSDSNGLISQVTIGCSDSLVVIEKIILDSCKVYYFQIKSFSDSCGTIYSDSVSINYCCPKPKIKFIHLTGQSGHVNVSYQTIGSCSSSCNLIVYDHHFAGVAEFSLSCGNDTIDISNITSCNGYYFVLSCYTEACGWKSDTMAFNPCCIKPEITGFGYDTLNSLVLVHYTPHPEYSSCSIQVFDEYYSVVYSDTLNCADSLLSIPGLNHCQLYYYQISGYNYTCHTIYSDTFAYTGGCCVKPVISNAYYDYSNANMIINYAPHIQYTGCSIEVYDPHGTPVTTISVDCADSTISVPAVFDPCRIYLLVMHSVGDYCEEFSDTFYYQGCCPKPKINQVYFDGNTANIIYQSQPGYTHCVIQVFQDNVNIYEHDISCSDTLATINDLDSCTIYRFRIWSYSRECDTLYSDYYQNRPCNRDITICTHTYTPIQLPQPVVIPPMLGCDYQKPCITCAKLDTLTAEFRTRFPDFSSVPYDESTASDDQVKQNNLWARFLNYRTGFSKNTFDYLDAYKKCHDSMPPVLAICAFSPPLNDPRPIFVQDTSPCKYLEDLAHFIAQQLYQNMRDSVIARFDSLYKAKCLSARYSEQFYATYLPKEYHYTLYYYDQAGNLVKTIPPAGVKPNYSSSFLNYVQYARSVGMDYATGNNENLATQYRYNTLNQVIAQITPDAGLSKFWYDRLGRLVVSQNAQQQTQNHYSYTLYDSLGRITEVGQSTNSTVMTQIISRDATALTDWIEDVSADTKKEITLTVYDIPYTSVQVSFAGQSGLYQQNLRNRVSYSMVFDDESHKNLLPDGTYKGGNSATYYSYDIHGNVDTLLQDYRSTMGAIACSNNSETKGNRFKKIVYNYDLISGKVNTVSYQPGLIDAYYHRYDYDDENRLTAVETSRDKIYWEREAAYSYYRHGPLSRTVLGQNQVQGLDYAYTIQGWLKGVNSTAVLTGTGNNYDMGQDGPLAIHNTARDIFGYSLNYFSGDYKPIGGASSFTRLTLPLPAEPVSSIATGASLYNGNIAAMAVNIPILGNAQVYGYRYDQLNRIARMDNITGLANNDTTITASRSDDYHEQVTYDPNGNIRSYIRNGYLGSGHLEMDSLKYEYISNTNKLKRVRDVALYSSNYRSDIDDQPFTTNYSYDAIGNLIQDKSEGIDSIKWTVYGKISAIYKSNNTHIVYSYDAAGNRISETVTTGSETKHTFYVRDATGNVMSIYKMKDTLKQKELMMYGSSRLGTKYVNTDVQYCNQPFPEITIFDRGNKFFELSNHLGNVWVTVTDKKRQHSTSGTVVDYYTAEVNTATDYYPFGMLMPGRQVYLDTTTRAVGNTSATVIPEDTTVITLYQHGFNDTASTHPYTTIPDVLNANLGASSWTNSQSNWESAAGISGRAIVLKDTRPDTSSATLTVNIASGKKLTIKSFSFYHKGLTAANSYGHWKMYINGTEVGDSSIYLGTTGMESTGTRLLTNPVENLTGAVTVVLKFFDHVAGGNIQGKVLLDDFVLNGYVNDEAAGTGSGYQYAQNGYYRYGFNGKENDNEVKGEGNQQDYGMRVYDSRLGRFLSVDPLGTKTPYISPYVFVSNRPIWSVDYDGRLDFIINYVTVDEKGKEIKRISQTIKIQTFEDIKGIDRTPVIINVYDKIVFVEISPGVRTSTVKRNVVIDKNSGETTAPLGEYYQRTAPFYVASNKFMLNVTGLFGGKQFGAVMDGRDPETGEFLTQKRKIGEVVDGVVSLLTLGRAAATGKVKSLIGELVVDMIVDKISGTLSEEVFKEKFGWTSEESVKFLWGIGKLIYDGRKGDVNKVIEYMLSAIKLGASAPKVADELNKNFGIDVKAPLDKKAATETVLKTIDK